MAMAAGLSCGIINPQSKPMMDAYYGYRALAGYDEGCKEYVQHYADAPKAAATTVSEMVFTMPLSKDCRDLRVRPQPRLWKAKSRWISLTNI